LTWDVVHGDDQKERADAERLKNLIYGNAENTTALTVENLLHLHQMRTTDIARTSR
jgi:hypothetical protein